MSDSVSLVIKNRFLIGLMIGIEAVTVVMIGLVRTAYVLDAFSFSIIPIAFSVWVIIMAGNYSLIINKKNVLITFALTVLFILMLSAEEILRMLMSMDGELFNVVFRLIYLPVLFFSVFTDVDYLLRKSFDNNIGISGQGTDGNEEGDGFRFIGIYKPVWLIAIVTFFFMIAYYPGAINPDLDLNLLKGGVPEWNDWHTVSFVIFCYLCMRIVNTPFMISFVQFLMFVFTANYTVGYLYRRFNRNRRIGYLYSVLYVTFCILCCMNVSDMCKDNCSTAMLLAFSVSILDYYSSDDPTRGQYVRLIIFGFLASLFRHFLIVIVIVSLMLMVLREYNARKDTGKERSKRCGWLLFVLPAVVLLYLFMTQFVGFTLLKARRNEPYVKYSVPMYLAASMAYRSSVTGLKIDDAVVEKMERVMPIGKWVDCFCPFDADTVARPNHDIGDDIYKLNDPDIAADILKVDVYYLTHYPRECILSFFDISSLTWEIAKPAELAMYSPAPCADNTSIHHLRKGSFYSFAEGFGSFLGSFAVGRSLVYRGGFSIFLLIVETVIMMKKKLFNEWIAMFPALFYAVSLMISMSQPISRYIMVFSPYALLFGIISYVVPARLNVQEKLEEAK